MCFASSINGERNNEPKTGDLHVKKKKSWKPSTPKTNTKNRRIRHENWKIPAWVSSKDLCQTREDLKYTRDNSTTCFHSWWLIYISFAVRHKSPAFSLFVVMSFVLVCFTIFCVFQIKMYYLSLLLLLRTWWSREIVALEGTPPALCGSVLRLRM